jgi:hypothetical protein
MHFTKACQTDQSLELFCEDHVGTYVIPFLCGRRSGAWQNAETGNPIEAPVVGWRVHGQILNIV